MTRAAPARALVLFTRDLRVHDNPVLAAALREVEEVVPAFVLDREILRRVEGAANRLRFLTESLRDLDASLRARGSALAIREGEVVEQTLKLAARWRASAVYVSADASPYARLRELRLRRACEEARIGLHVLGGPWLLAPGAVTPAGGDHYRVFTPYWRAWQAQPRESPAPAPRRIASPAGIRSGRVPALSRLTGERASPRLLAGGESAARERLRGWRRGGLADYERRRDELAADATSRLSPYLRFGCVSARELAGCGGEFARQLCWRDFFLQVLAARPDLPHADYRPRAGRWRTDRRTGEAWRAGLTGYPIVDAGMRQLAQEGFMHNRARMIVASFLTRRLRLDWRIGAAHFARLLLDAELASNVGNWQWMAGTGNDTRPNRVLNPLRQAARFDPQGEYVRRYVAELSDVEGAAVHEPWRLPAARRRALDYPQPLL
jgi:deoxyribodipyrimidine photo-lyase